MSDELLVVGAIAGAFGVRGEIRVKSFTADPAALFSYGPLLGEDGAVVLTVAKWRVIKDGFAVTAKEVANREAAEALKSTRLCAPRSALPDLDEDEYYHADLIGMSVRGLDGSDLGEVRDVHDFGAGDLLEIWRTPGVTGAWYLPFTRLVVPHVDLKAGVITADPPVALEANEADETGEEPD